ncbi:hypothetical protein KGF56_003388 [Candida oxycetoniae]|uniref:CAP-Gly domain-containing protein n=1 Tax=Candida oxycetoniae TaxID=497107 RepID=A0AAI9SVH7_9ASCO|nr:uncharacterized protein KGF56_003388 [Candida oxycetoniae]KAI3403828.1 hypothetical protein KGF56_003388 [Candida oxycetoniae]
MSDINIFITSDLTSSERRISPQWSLHYLKQRLEQITGVEPCNQIIQYFPNKYSNEFHRLTSGQADEEDTLLSELGLKEYSRIHVIDADPNSTTNQLINETSPSNVPMSGGGGGEEFQLTEEEYQKKNNTVLQWKREQRLGRFDPDYEMIQEKIKLENEAAIANIHVGDRCRVINIEGERRGTVRFVGKIDHLDQGKMDWVGVEFDEPVGKNSGDIGGIPVFECKYKHGSFFKPKQVEVGDFPILDPFAEDESMEDSDEEL